MRQSWRELTFLHWRFDPAVVRAVVPGDLALDVYDGSAWVGLVPFIVADLTLPNAPAVPWLSTFAETNVRTYVIDRNGRRGVWFFSLDAARLLAVLGARTAYALPYIWAKMRVERNGTAARYESLRHLARKGRSRVEVRIGEPISEPSELDVFLTARFRLFAKRRGQLLMAEVEHAPWRLRRATLIELEDTLLNNAGLPRPTSDPLVHFGGNVDVLVGGLSNLFRGK
jgi:uncharacterized protein YqjF (DUF2071 family)